MIDPQYFTDGVVSQTMILFLLFADVHYELCL